MKVRELQEDIHLHYGLKVHTTKASKVRAICLVEVDNILKDHYAKLWDYANELVRTNPGSTVKIVSEDRVFQRMYICFGAVNKGWKQGCISVIGSDGAFLKGYVKGEFLTAVGRDGNNQMFPIAWAVVSDGETNDSWVRFLQLLMEYLDISQGIGLTLITDQQKGLIPAIQELHPLCEYRMCAIHVYANYKKLFGAAKMKELFWKACNTGNKVHHGNILNEIKKNIVPAYNHIIQRDPKHWCRAHFSNMSTCDSVENNMCECLNGLLVEARRKPIIRMLEDIRVYIMEMLVKRREIVKSWCGQFGPRIKARLEKGIEESRNWTCIHSGNNKFEVKHTRGNFVYTDDMSNRFCSCGLWQLSGIPCCHSVCAIYYLRDKHENHVSKWYNLHNPKKVYDESMHPLNGETLWEKTEVLE